MKNLKRIKVAGLTGLAALTFGCDTTQPPAFVRPEGLLGLSMIGNAAVNPDLTPNQAAVMDAAGNVALQSAYLEAQGENAVKAARAGRSQVNVNVHYPNPNNVSKVFPFEVGKTYQTTYLAWGYDNGKIWNKEGKFRGFGRINRGKGWEITYEFDTKDGKLYVFLLPHLISAKPLD